jgi:predicted Fe-Mo cluster-binding NifX family protein
MSQTKIAFVTDDGTTISAHFGRAMFYEIVTLDGTAVIHRERVPKAGHHAQGGQQDHGHGAGHSHGHDHGDMISPIRDCSTLVARGMGMGAHNAIRAMGITPILADDQTIDAALAKYIDNSLANNERRLHDHGAGHTQQGH